MGMNNDLASASPLLCSGASAVDVQNKVARINTIDVVMRRRLVIPVSPDAVAKGFVTHQAANFPLFKDSGCSN